MKIKKMKEHLCDKLKNKRKVINKIKKEFRNFEHNDNKLNDLKIIGITGSYGKSTTAVIVHEYLKLLGYKSVLYSSARIDSPASIMDNNEACEVSFNTEEGLLEIIEEAEAYGADYLVLEINETTIEKGLISDIPFDIRALTNLNPKHNLEQYSEEEYVNLKKIFFKNINDDCKCVIGLQNYDKELFDEILSLNSYPKYIFTSDYIATIKNVNNYNFTCLLTELDSTLEGLKMKVLVDGIKYNLSTKVLMSYNILNFVCAMTILKALNILDMKKFQECIYDIKIPGRVELYKYNNRMIIVDAHLPKVLECLYDFKEKGLVNKIKVVVGSIGKGFKTWNEKFKSEHFSQQHTLNKKYCMDLLKKYSDFVYLTENDNASESVLDICLELQKYLDGQVSSIIIEDREQAIRQAIKESEEGDVIFISGRGNRRTLCNSYSTMKLLKDGEVVEEVLKELGW